MDDEDFTEDEDTFSDFDLEAEEEEFEEEFGAGEAETEEFPAEKESPESEAPPEPAAEEPPVEEEVQPPSPPPAPAPEPIEGLVAAADLPVTVKVELGRVRLNADRLLHLQPGNFLELNKTISQGVDLVVNGERVGRGELIRVGDLVGVRVTELG